ncbi:NAD(P)-dependent oxidoreductase [Candidatus Woesearchaeota archaeon]|nr:NAD(P)-dependent oxidoreductase [Candidatus Woesearchaeota archaeon]
MYLVTGGAGYIGGCLAKELLRHGEVRILDRQGSKYIPKGADFVCVDIRNKDAVKRAMEGVDVVYHLAFVQSLSKMPLKDKISVNFGGTRNVFETAVDQGVGRVVHTSSIEVYGTNPPVPCTEDAPLDEPVGWYGAHKWYAEKIANEYKDRIDTSILRMPTVCGKGFYNHKPLLTLMDRILTDKPVAVFDNGRTRGDMVHIDDVISGYLLAGREDAAIGEIFNISCDKHSTHREVVESCITEINSVSHIINLPKSISTPCLKLMNLFAGANMPEYQFEYVTRDNVYSVDKAKQLLGFSPKHSAAEAAAELIRCYAQDKHYINQRCVNY